MEQGYSPLIKWAVKLHPGRLITRCLAMRIRFTAAIIALTVPLFFIENPIDSSNELARLIWNYGHIPFFGVVTFLVMQVVPLASLKRQVVFTLFLFLGSVGLEWFQSLIGRDASWHDVSLNLTGCWLAIYWLQPSNLTVILGRVFATSLLAIQLIEPADTLYASYRMQTDLPTIATFENADELRRWTRRIRQSKEFVSEGAYSGKYSLSAARHSSVSLRKIAKDWSDYQSLLFDIYNPGPSTLKLTLHIHDYEYEENWNDDDGFNKELIINPGWTTFEISLSDIENGPQKRKLDLRRMKYFSLYSTALENSVDLYIDNVRLR